MRKDEGRTTENGKGSSQEMRGEQSERLEGGESWNSRVAAKQNKGSGAGGKERKGEK